MNIVQPFSIFMNCIIAVGSSALLLQSNDNSILNKDFKELNLFLASIFSSLNLYIIYSLHKDEKNKIIELNTDNNVEDNLLYKQLSSSYIIEDIDDSNKLYEEKI